MNEIGQGGAGVAQTDLAREAKVVVGKQQLQKLAMALCLATTCAVAWSVTAGTGVAAAATRSRSGALHTLLFDATARVAPNGASSSRLHLTGPDVMASFVGLMAVLAFVFLVVTFIRRRVSVPA
jgi:hypothetical protein